MENIYYLIRKSNVQYQYFSGYTVNQTTQKLICNFGLSDDGISYPLLNEAIALATALRSRFPDVQFEVVAAYDSGAFTKHKTPTDVVWKSEP